MFRPILFIVALVICLAGCGSKSKEELQAEGAKQLKAGNVNGAIVLFKSALEKDPNYLDARHQLAQAYVAVTKYEQAEKELQKLQRQDPSQDAIVLELGALYNLTGRGELAVEQAQNFLKRHPDSPDAYDVLGTAFLVKKSFEEAERSFLKALQLAPNRNQSRVALAAVYAGEGKASESRELLAQVTAADPKNVRAYGMLARLELSQGNKDKALGLYRRILEINPNDVGARFQCGMLYVDAKDYDSAIKMASDLLAKNAKRPEGHLIRGIVLYKQKSYSDAVIELQKTVQIAKSPVAYYYLGLSHYSRGELELASGQLRKALDADPNKYQARLLIATILLKQKRFDEAAAEAQRVVQFDPNIALGHNLLGNAYLGKGQSDQAMKEFNKALEIDPKMVDAHLKKGIYQLSTGRSREGEVELENAVQLAPDVLNSRYLLAAYYAKRGEDAKAEDTLRRGLKGGGKSDALLLNALAQVLFKEKKEAEAVQSLQKAKQVDPAFFPSYFALAQYRAGKGAPDKALAEYTEVLKVDPKNVTALQMVALNLENSGKVNDALGYLNRAKDTKTQEGYLALASFLVRQQQPDKALKLLDEALKSEPRNETALEMAGKALAGQKKYREALQYFDRLEPMAPSRAVLLKMGAYLALKDTPKALEIARGFIKTHPNSALGYSALASVYESQNDLARAADALKEGLKVEPGNNPLRLTLAGIYAKKKEYGPALGLYQELLKRQPGNAVTTFGLGMLYQEMGKKAEAEKKYREALKRAPDFVSALNNLACLCAEGNGRRAEALKLASRASQLSPGDPRVMDTMGYCLLINGKKDDAAKLLEKASALLPKDPAVHYHLALAYKDQGRRPQAVQSLQKSLQLGDFPEAAQAKQLLAQLKG